MSTQRSRCWYLPIRASTFVAIVSLGLTGCPVEEVEPGPNVHQLALGTFQGTGSVPAGDTDVWTFNIPTGLTGHFRFEFNLPPESDVTIGIGTENWRFCYGPDRCFLTGQPGFEFDVPLQVWPGIYATSVSIWFHGFGNATSSDRKYAFNLVGPPPPTTTSTSTTTSSSTSTTTSTLPPSVCGNGTLEAGEQCDDGNVAHGDGCSPTCLLQSQPLQVNCTASTQSAYLAAFGNDGEFTNMWDYAIDRGYDPTLRGALACDEGYGTTSFMANLAHPTLPALVIVSRHGDVAPGFNTFLYQTEAASVRWVHASTFSMKIFMTGSNQVQDIEFYGVDGTLLTASAPSGAAALAAGQLALCSDEYARILDCERAYFASPFNIIAIGATIVSIGQCAASINPVTGALAPITCGAALASTIGTLGSAFIACPYRPEGVACSDEETCAPGTCRWSGGRETRVNCIPTPGAPSACGGASCCDGHGQCLCTQDDFERASLGPNWTPGLFYPSETCEIWGVSDLGGGDNGATCYWNGSITPAPATAQYACAQLSGPVAPTDLFWWAGAAGPCLAMDGSGDGVCCVAAPWEHFSNDVYFGWWGMWAARNTTVTSGPENDFDEKTITEGDFLGIERDSNGTTFRCYHSTDGRTWDLLGQMGAAGLPIPGQPGVFADRVQGDYESFTIERWEAGNGGLPTSRVCGM